jgi:predicted anti-sigma-YlaC factor YlaD
MFLPCREFTRDATDHLEGAQTGLRAWRVRLHLLVCRGCRVYRDQLRATTTVLRAHSGDAGEGRRMLEALAKKKR